ncbi:aminotransferase [Adhaeribacter aerolatus]|uniref:Aminotransferase n=1 Tax=Adhaeribacter aerolatus TaxID=670289 RepID=A0A512AUI3_9BACT|nr:DegT/DnrJ/EryC1/StrS family aminotransferase [Adhaeribacter aerolatus]GEO03237.1 aminotransferase [Adhaeribacter aerolatus]
MQVPYLSFDAQNALIREQVLAAMAAVFDSKWYILGNYLRSFEEAYAAFSNTKYCVGVGNGFDALQIALKALVIGPGDEVIVPSHTFIATWLAVSAVGANIVPVEPDERTYNITAETIRKVITSRTKAIIPVHLYGQACDMAAIMSLAAEFNLQVIEDNAQAQGATFKGRPTGSFGNLNATSFYPVKNLGALGDAGALTTDSPELAEKARFLQNYGSSQKYHHEVLGVNSRLDELQAAILSQKLPWLNKWNEERQAIAGRYQAHLSNLPDLVLPVVAPGATHVYHIFMIRTPRRDALQKYLAGKGIGTAIHYPIPPHRQKAYAYLGFAPEDFPIANLISATGLSLPLWPGLTQEKTDYICTEIINFFNQL